MAAVTICNDFRAHEEEICHCFHIGRYVVPSTYLRLLIFLPEILISAYNLSSQAFHIMCLAYKLNKQGDNKQPCHTLSSILKQSAVLCLVLTVASWPPIKVSQEVGKMVCCSHLFKNFPQIVVSHTVKSSA